MEAYSLSGPFAAVRDYIDAFNVGDLDAMAASFADRGSILDGMAPHAWQGDSVARDWYREVLLEGERTGASDYHVTLGQPAHATVTGDAAYLVAPATMTFKLRGERVTQSGATFTVALRKIDDAWRIASWAWTKGQSAA